MPVGLKRLHRTLTARSGSIKDVDTFRLDLNQWCAVNEAFAEPLIQGYTVRGIGRAMLILFYNQLRILAHY